jgi:paraquat-inducible protein A
MYADQSVNDRETTSQWMACHECDYLHEVSKISGDCNAYCTRCNALLFKGMESADKALAYTLTSLLLFLIANSFPLLSLHASGQVQGNVFLSSSIEFFYAGMPEVGVLVFLTSFLFPLLTILGLLYLLIPAKLGYRPWGMAQVHRMVIKIKPWSLLGVFMLGILLSLVKLLDLALVVPGISMYSFGALLVTSVLAHSHYDAHAIWEPLDMLDSEHKEKIKSAESAPRSFHLNL